MDLTRSDGLRESLPAVWLCDNAQDAFDGQTGQRRLGLARRRPDPVRPPPPSPRLLHAIRADAEGGATCFADGFAHARALEEAAPEAFERLARQPVEFSFRAPDGAFYRARRPLIEVGPDGTIPPCV